MSAVTNNRERVLALLAQGFTVRATAHATGLSTQRVYQIRAEAAEAAADDSASTKESTR